MKSPACLLFLTVASFLAIQAEINVPSDGSDGDFITTASQNEIVIDLATARSGSWDEPQSEPLQPVVGGPGTYDKAKWAVVFKYNSVLIHKDTKVRFKNHASRAPVVWLVKGDVRIDGGLDLSAASNGPIGEPGPGGFRGAQGGSLAGVAGFGPGASLVPSGGALLAPGYGTPGFSEAGEVALRGPTYGNSQIIPLIGGSGFSGTSSGISGAAGGGAILIAARGFIVVDGEIHATSHGTLFPQPPGFAGPGRWGYSGTSYGSGGAIRLVADRLSGNGVLRATSGWSNTRTDALGRIRLEATTTDGGLSPFPIVPVVPPSNPPQIWPLPAAPAARILSVDGKPMLEDPRAFLGPPAADQSFISSGESLVEIETTNMEPDRTEVRVRITPRVGDPTRLLATYKSGDTARAVWTVSTALPAGFAAIQVHAVGK